MKQYQLRNTILDLLIRIEKDEGFSHLIINHAITAKGIDQKDEGLLTEVVYGTLDRKLTLDYYLSPFIKANKKLDPWVLTLLRMSVYQMVFLDRIPDHAIIHEAVEIAKQRGHKGIASLVNGVLRSLQRKGVPNADLIEDDIKRLSIQTSHPEWLIRSWKEQYGYETTKAMCEENLKRKANAVRVQLLKISRDEAMAQLTEEGFEIRPSIFSSQGIIIDKGNILKSKLFSEGYVTVQDQSSMLVAEMLDVEPGMQVLDACSAPGGKVTHIAEKMENKGTIHAHDLHKKKIQTVNDKADNLDLTIIQTMQADARKLQDTYPPAYFDRILVDAPCSGLGVIRGKPEIKYTKQEHDIEKLAAIQLEILKSIAPLLKQDGCLIYSTCTVDKRENEEVVKQFLAANPNYEIDQAFHTTVPDQLKERKGKLEFGLQLFPQDFHTDGFFLTRMKKMN